jgi:hypothetical protein
MPDREQNIAINALNHLQAETGLSAELQPFAASSALYGFAYIAAIAGIEFLTVFMSSISEGSKHLIYKHLETAREKLAGRPTLVVSGYIPRAIAREYREAGINYLDEAGNCSLHHGQLAISIQGKTIPKAAKSNSSRAFQEAGIRIIFELLQHPFSLNRSYRELAQRVGVSLGSVSSVLQDLSDMDFIFGASKKRVWKNRAGLLDRWVTAYHDILRPRLLQKRLRFSQTEQFYNWDHLPLLRADNVLLWGGETGAALLTHQLTPEKFTLYAKGSWRDVMRALELVPMEDGPIEVLDMFWM